MNRRLIILSALAGLSALLPAGCGEREQITRYTVPKPHALHEANHAEREVPGHPAIGPRMGSPDDKAPENRLLGAIITRGAQTWFFKLTGPDEAVQGQMGAFFEFARSIRFPDGEESKPTWTLPDGWNQLPGSSMRYATLEIGSGPRKLEVSVIPLPTLGPDPDTYVLDNIKRWRGQVGLDKEIDSERVFANESPFEEARRLVVDGVAVILVNLVSPRAPSRKSDASPTFGPSAGGGSDSKSSSKP